MVRRLSARLIPLLFIAACAAPDEPPAPAIRLVDLYDPALVSGSAGGATTPPERTEWRFDGPAPETVEHEATRGWEAGPGITGLAIRDGRLVGRTTRDDGLLHLAREVDENARDTLHAVEIRMRVSGGANLQVDFNGREQFDFKGAADYIRAFEAGVPSSPIVAGDELRTYTLRPVMTVVASGTRNVVLRPTDAANATFEIESVRLVFRHEHLEGIPSGVAWQGLSEVYAETLVARSPEELRFELALPVRPWLDLSLGTVEDGPVTFRVRLDRGSKEPLQLLERTLTRPHRWERAPIDLAEYAGQEVTLSLALDAERKGAIGFWGAPVVRSRGTPPPSTTDRAGRAAAPQGLILIWADTLRRDHLSAYGYERETAPVVEARAREGVLFRNSISQGTWTKVSTPTLLTGLYPSTHGVSDFTDRLPAGATTLAEVFRDAGFATLSLSSILFTGQFTNLHQGFEELHESGSLPDPNTSKTARDYVDRLLPWLEAHRDDPFFVFLHVSDPHDPYRPYAPYDGMWADLGRAAEHERRAREVRKFIDDPLMKLFGMPSRAELLRAGYDPDDYVAFDRAWYDGSIRGMDAEIGRLQERLRTLGLAERTLVVFTADHGEEFLEHGRMFHGQSVYGELTNMPLILWGPGFLPRGGTVDATVETVDLMPTILDVFGLDLPEGVQGDSLLPWIEHAQGPGPGAVAAHDPGEEAPAFSEKATTSAGGGGPPPHDTESWAVTHLGWKLVQHTKRPEGAPEFELFEVQDDHLDLRNVAAEHPDVVARLAAQLAAFRERTRAERLKSDSEAAQDLKPEELERLRSLGYIR